MTAMSIINALAVSAGLYVAYNAMLLYQSYRINRRSGFPVHLMPSREMNILWIVYTMFNRRILPYLPFGLSEWPYLRFWSHDWPMHPRFGQFGLYGDCIHLVYPGGSSLFVANAEVAREIYSRRDDFTKDVRFYKWVRFYGNNVLTTEGKEWAKHRRVTGPPFNDTINPFVWKETITQAIGLQRYWSETNKRLTKFIVNDDCQTLARNVISAAGFGIKLPFETSNELSEEQRKTLAAETADFESKEQFGLHKIPSGHRLSFGDSLVTLLDNMMIYVACPSFLLKHGPKIARKTGLAYEELGSYIKELLEYQKKQSGGTRTLLSALADSAEQDTEKPGYVLTEEELLGNIFLFTVAGMETTAGTLQYILYLLALHPGAQSWLQDELKREIGSQHDPSTWEFEELFPKLVAPLCVIYETLRIFSSHVNLPKWTADKPQTLSYRGQICHLQPGTTVFITLRGLHDNPEYWGDQTFGFHPAAWDARQGHGWTRTNPETGDRVPIAGQSSKAGGSRNQKAPFCHLRSPPVPGCYVPFSDGVRSCLGQMFALVEMAVVIAVLFSGDTHLEISCREGETKEQAHERAWKALHNSTQYSTLMIRQNIELCWVVGSAQ